MKKVKVSELVGVQLDWAVAQCANISVSISKTSERIILFLHPLGSGKWCPSRRWDQGGPIIDREWIAPSWVGEWSATKISEKPSKDGTYSYLQSSAYQYGNTLLIAAMRCYVASKLGDVVEIPEEL